jgi:hypothetical protein
MKKHLIPTIGGACLALSLLFAHTARAAEVNVTPGNLNGWQLEPTGGSTVSLVDGPGDPPLGTGSAQFSVDVASSPASLRNGSYAGLGLDEITALKYSTYVQDTINERAPSIALHVDHDNDGVADDVIVFEPAYQDVLNFPGNPQGDVIADTWQSWNALTGGWYSANGELGTGPGEVISLLDYIAEFPDSAIVNVAGAGGVTIVAGEAAEVDWLGFLGNADAFTLNGTTFDFELVEDADNDGVPDDEDAFPNSDMRPFVDVGNGPTTVKNVVLEDGATIQDLVNEAMENARNHGQYVSAIARLANDLRKDGTITQRESVILKNGAAKSSIGKPKPKAKPAPASPKGKKS